MLRSEPVNAPSIDGACQVVIHFLLRVLIVIRPRPDPKSEV